MSERMESVLSSWVRRGAVVDVVGGRLDKYKRLFSGIEVTGGPGNAAGSASIC